MRILCYCVRGFLLTISQNHKNTGLLKGHRNQVKCLLAVNGVLWSGADDATIMIWKAVCCNTAECARRAGLLYYENANVLSVQNGDKQKLEGHKSAVLTLVQVGNQVWSGSADKSIIVWDCEVC